MTIKVAVVGARGYTGSELLPLLWRHPGCEIVAVGSGSAAGEEVTAHVPGLQGCSMRFSSITPDSLADFPADLYVLALPNGHAAGFVASIDRQYPKAVVIDLSADYRFDDNWAYGQPERFASRIRTSRRIANPGCYATGSQLALAPVIADVIETPVVFGVSGFSGAGKTPSRKNDPEVLRDNLLPYTLSDHLHEKEVSRHLGRDIRFLPHVAPFFRGISLTVAAQLSQHQTPSGLLDRFRDCYAGDQLLTVQAEIPEVAQVRGRHGVIIGGFTVSETDARRITIVAVLDNLLKGAATQAVQNLNLAFGLDPLAGIRGENQ
jgi:N-acetyl-gamma-glutamyl-phosphate reductase